MALGMMLAVMGGMLVCVQNTFNAKVKEQVGAWVTTTLVLALGFLASLLVGLVSEGFGLFAVTGMETWYWFSGIIGVGVVMSVTQGVQQLGPSHAMPSRSSWCRKSCSRSYGTRSAGSVSKRSRSRGRQRLASC